MSKNVTCMAYVVRTVGLAERRASRRVGRTAVA